MTIDNIVVSEGISISNLLSNHGVVKNIHLMKTQRRHSRRTDIKLDFFFTAHIYLFMTYDNEKHSLCHNKNKILMIRKVKM